MRHYDLLGLCIYFLPFRVQSASCTPPSLRARADEPSRHVYIIADMIYGEVAISPQTGDTLLYGHSSLHIDGNSHDGPLRIEQVQPNPSQFAIRVLDYTAPNSNRPIGKRGPDGSNRYIWSIGQTRLRNAQFADPSTGKGLVLDVWGKDPIWVQGSNCCFQFVQKLAKALGLESGWQYDLYVSNAAEYAKLALPALIKTRLPLYLESIGQWGDTGATRRVIFDTTDLETPRRTAMPAASNDMAYLPDTAEDTALFANQPLRPVWDETTNVPGSLLNGDSDAPASGQTGPGAPSAETNHPSEDIGDTGTTEARTISALRITEIYSDITVVARGLAVTAGIVGYALAPVFIILDFVNGNPVGGAYGIAGLLAGAAAASSIGGPVGWLFAGFIALFSILPGFFTQSAPQYPSANNTTEIIQYAMFGDKTHTGNEKCRAGTDGQPGNPNCTAVYGPGVLATSFKWNNFDPIAFLIQYNAGYPMSIPDIASAFQIVDARSSDGADKIATITCQAPPYVCHRFDCKGRQPHSCARATFALNRELITIPALNQTAGRIYDRIIPKPGGDCKLISNAGGVDYTDYNLSLTGAPAAIACNLTASLNVGGTVVLINDTNANNGLPAAFSSPGNASTDGSVHEVAAPVATGFASGLDASTSVCLDGTGGSMCFPNGTYDIQQGSLGFDSSKVDSLTLPHGAALTFTIPAIGIEHSPLRMVSWTYTTNQTPQDKAFSTHMASITADSIGPRTFNILLPGPSPPVVCLFTQLSYRGDVACYGPGTGGVGPQVANTPRSMSLHGSVTAWIYGQYYGDDGGQLISTDIPDLTAIPLGVAGTFDKMIKALWVIGA